MKALSLTLCGLLNVAALVGVVIAPASDVTFLLQGLAVMSIGLLLAVTLIGRAKEGQAKPSKDAGHG